MSVDDDALRSMLTTRAERASAGAADEVMRAVRAEVREPRQGATFSVLPVLTGRSPVVGAGFAAAAMIAVLVMVVVATRPPTAAPSASSIASAIAAPTAASVGTPSPSPSLPAGLTQRQAVQIAAAHVQTLPIDPLNALISATAGAYRDVALGGAVGPAPSIPPSQLVWAVTFDTGWYCTSGMPGHCGVAQATVFIDHATGAYLGAQTWSPSMASQQITLVDLRRALSDSSLDGHIVLVDGTLQQQRSATCGQPSCPADYALRFVGPVVTEQRPGQPVTPARPGAGSAPLAGTFLVVPWRGTLILVGRMEGSLGSPIAVAALANAYTPSDPAAEIALQAVSGQITAEPMSCPSFVPGASACLPAYLLTDPAAPGAAPTPVRMAAPALGVADGRTVDGPFLVRTSGSQLQVVGRYDPGAITTVSIPAVTCDLAGATPLLSCDKLVSDTLAALPPSTQVTAVDIAQGAACHPPQACPPLASSAHATVHTPTGDWRVSLVYDPDGTHVASVEGPSPSP